MASDFDSFAGGFLQGFSAVQKWKNDKALLDLRQQQLNINKSLADRQNQLSDIKISEAERMIQMRNGMTEAFKKGGFLGTVDYLNEHDPELSLKYQNLKVELDRGLLGNKRLESAYKTDELKRVEAGYTLIGNIGSQFLKIPEDQKAEAYSKVLRPQLQQIAPSFKWPAEYQPGVNHAITIAIGQAVPANQRYEALLQQNKTKTEAEKMIQQARIAEQNGDMRTADQLNAELQKRRMIKDPESGNYYDLGYGNANPDKTARLTQTESIAAAEKASADIPTLARGNPITEQYKKELETQHPQRQPGAYKTPTGFRKIDIRAPEKGIEAIPMGPQDKASLNDAGKIQMLRIAQASANTVKRAYYAPEGEGINGINYGTVVTTQNVGIPFTSVQTKGVPWTKGRTIRAAYESGIQAITRIETGAAMRDEELINTMDRIFPSVFDSPETVKYKLLAYEAFVTGSLKLVAPGPEGKPRFDQKRFDDTMELLRQGATLDEVLNGKVPTKPELNARKKELSKYSENEISLLQKYQNDPQMKKYIKAFINHPANKKKGATPLDAIKFKLKQQGKL